jgi:glycine/D-amino acid oxidase-like deaminating enzyme
MNAAMSAALRPGKADTYDVVVIGNGVLGTATALQLSRADSSLRIALVAPDTRPGAASTAAGAMLGCFGEVTHDTLNTRLGRAKLEMSLRSQEEWPTWLEKLNDELPEHRRLSIKHGTYVILNGKGGRLDDLNYAAILDALHRYGRSFQDVTQADVPGLRPAIDARPFRAVYIPDEGAIDARDVLDALTYAANRRGITMIDDLVADWEQSGDHVLSAVTHGGQRISASQFLIAAGAGSGRLMHLLAGKARLAPPILCGVGTAFTCRQPMRGVDAVVRTPNRAGACGLHVVPGDTDSLYVGATNDLYALPQADTRAGMAHFLLSCALEQIDTWLASARIVKWHLGNRPATLDGFPLIGRLWADNVWVLSGTYRDGFHCSPFLARHMTDLMLGGTGILPDDHFAPLRPVRSALSREESIDEMVLHHVSSAYEYSARLPGLFAQVMEEDIRERTKILYERLETDYGLGPDILPMLLFSPGRERSIRYFRDYLAQGRLSEPIEDSSALGGTSADAEPS